MSIVTGFCLITSCCDDQPNLLAQVWEWLGTLGYPPPKEVADHANGGKHPQMRVYIAGWNHFFENEELVRRLAEIRWECPENVVLTLQPEDGRSTVWRPKESQNFP